MDRSDYDFDVISGPSTPPRGAPKPPEQFKREDVSTAPEKAVPAKEKQE
jgi:hypothetical protein